MRATGDQQACNRATDCKRAAPPACGCAGYGKRKRKAGE